MGSINIFKPLFTFLKAVPLINLSKVDIFYSESFLGNAGNQTQGSWIWKQVCKSLCYAAPFSWLTFNPLSDEELQFKALIQFFIH